MIFSNVCSLSPGLMRGRDLAFAWGHVVEELSGKPDSAPSALLVEIAACTVFPKYRILSLKYGSFLDRILRLTPYSPQQKQLGMRCDEENNRGIASGPCEEFTAGPASCRYRGVLDRHAGFGARRQ
jgi:hypothetical protein